MVLTLANREKGICFFVAIGAPSLTVKYCKQATEATTVANNAYMKIDLQQQLQHLYIILHIVSLFESLLVCLYTLMSYQDVSIAVFSS